MRMCARVRSRLGTSDGGWAGRGELGGRNSGPGRMGGLKPPPGSVSSLPDWEREINVLAAAPCLVPHPDPDPAF